MDSSLKSAEIVGDSGDVGLEGETTTIDDTIDYKQSFVKINFSLCAIDALAFLILAAWVIFQPQMLNSKRKEEGDQQNESKNGD